MKRKLSLSKIIIFSLYIIFIGLIIFAIVKILTPDKKTVDISVVDSIENYNYKLESSATKYQKSLFKELSELLSKEDYSIEEYAKLISKLFVTDFYTLDNKLNKNDIGGLQYIYSYFKEDFISYSKETVYKTVKNNMYGDRNQKLPIVTGAEVLSISNDEFKYNSDTLDAYYVDINVSYEEDLGYPTSISLVLVKNNNKIEVVKMETK
ncbi:MAG: hypothetical protein NC181_02795 [Clostridium sp.]|nr:hypothetical protein [Clostridium sp.]MCM1444110.1 hypothetical protein [Candidatus Amulumruptor caecigallinarius]